jgi:transposase
MRDTELYRHLLSVVDPWIVQRVDLSVEEQRVDVWVDHAQGSRWPCPECANDLSVYDHSEERSWRHLDSCQFMTFLHASPPRVRCPEHGVRQILLPWAEPMSRFTALFERLAIDVLKACDVSSATRILRISWDEAYAIMERAVARGRAAKEWRVPAHIGVDEKAAAKGHRYLTVVSDIDQGTVEYVAEDRTSESLGGYFQAFSPEERTQIKAVAMDMWQPYIAAVRAHLDDADDKIVFDRYHVMWHLNQALDHVRKREHRMLRAQGNDILLRSKYLWLYSFENLPEHHRDRFDELRSADLKTARAWGIKENLRLLWDYQRKGWADKHWKQWYYWATHSRLAPIVAAAKTLDRHVRGVLNYFDHPITNALAEGLNSKIQTIKKRAYGFRNSDHFKTAIYFHCGGLQLYPVTHGIPG